MSETGRPRTLANMNSPDIFDEYSRQHRLSVTEVSRSNKGLSLCIDLDSRSHTMCLPLSTINCLIA